MMIDNLLDLNRPEYYSSNELLLSSMAWGMVGKKNAISGIVYEYCEKRSAKARKLETRKILEAHAPGIIAKYDFNVSGLADPVSPFLDGFRATRAENSFAYPVLPLVAYAALLQDDIGVLNKNNPPNYAQIINAMYSLGVGKPCAEDAASRAWWAIATAPEVAPLQLLLADLARSFWSGATEPVLSAASDRATSASVPRLWLQGQETPFSWFARSWDSFCTPAWRNALPRRRWCDWASCILRTAIGLGFLWEAHLYEWLGVAASSKEKAIPLLPIELLPWAPAHMAVSSRDVANSMRRVVSLRESMRSLLKDKGQDTQDGLAEARTLEDLAKIFKASTATIREEIMEAFKGDRPASDRNLWFTIVYSLLCRTELGDDADFYSLLRRKGNRFIVVEPAAEWLVVVASLAAGAPGKPTTLGRLRGELHAMGLFPSRDVLVAALEKAGLAKGSPDSDDALEIAPAFGVR